MAQRSFLRTSSSGCLNRINLEAYSARWWFDSRECFGHFSTDFVSNHMHSGTYITFVLPELMWADASIIACNSLHSNFCVTLPRVSICVLSLALALVETFPKHTDKHLNLMYCWYYASKIFFRLLCFCLRGSGVMHFIAKCECNKVNPNSGRPFKSGEMQRP